MKRSFSTIDFAASSSFYWLCWGSRAVMTMTRTAAEMSSP